MFVLFVSWLFDYYFLVVDEIDAGLEADRYLTVDLRGEKTSSVDRVNVDLRRSAGSDSYLVVGRGNYERRVGQFDLADACLTFVDYDCVEALGHIGFGMRLVAKRHVDFKRRFEHFAFVEGFDFVG